MRLVNADRGGAVVAPGAAVHPVAIGPAVARNGLDDRRRFRRMLRAEGHGIGLQDGGAVLRQDLELVGLARLDAGQKHLPHAGPDPAHRRAPPVPGVEIANHRDAPRVGRPDREMHAGDPLMRDRMRAERVPQPPVGAFADQVDVHVAQHAAKAVGIVILPASGAVAAAQPVAALTADIAGKNPVAQRRQGHLAASGQRAQACGKGIEGNQMPRLAPVPGAKYDERIINLSGCDPLRVVW